MGGGGLSSYYGDLNNPGDIIDTNGSLFFGLQYSFADRWEKFSAIGCLESSRLNHYAQSRGPSPNGEESKTRFEGVGGFLNFAG